VTIDLPCEHQETVEIISAAHTLRMRRAPCIMRLYDSIIIYMLSVNVICTACLLQAATVISCFCGDSVVGGVMSYLWTDIGHVHIHIGSLCRYYRYYIWVGYRYKVP